MSSDTIAIRTTCTVCAKTGYLLDQTYGHADIPTGWTPVQRCDTCDTFAGDYEAALSAAADHDTIEGWFDPVYDATHEVTTEGTLPGDHAIRWTATPVADVVPITPDIDVTDGPILSVSQNTDGQSFDGFEMTIPEISRRLALLAARGHHVVVEIHVDDPNRETD